MLTNLANYLNNDFPFHMFFAVQILLVEGLFVVRMKSRLRPLKIVLPVVLCYLVLAWFHPLLGHRFARVAAIFAESLLVLCLTLPLFLMAAFVGLVDGLVRRDIRRFGAGRESGFIYHRARGSLTPMAVLPSAPTCAPAPMAVSLGPCA